MNGLNVKETMEQIHISEEMQEEIIMNVKNRMENGKNKTRNWKKIAVSAAVVALTAGIVSIPVQAVVKNIVLARMESIPQEEVQAINDMVQEERNAEADGFSREYSDEERERSQVLWQEYENGRFPDGAIVQVADAEDVTEGMFCYIRSTGVFHLPDQEMTDEEILEIIDFQHKMSYAVSQGPAAQEARAEMQAEENEWRERIQAAGGISEEEAIEIATRQMETEIGARAEGKEILRYEDGSVAVIKIDISEQTNYEHEGDVAYIVHFYNPEDHSLYECTIDAVDGSILYINTNEPMPEE